MSLAQIMQARRAHRAALLQLATQLLQSDARVVAAWLHGSMGRGVDDDWSDIDLWVVGADEQMEALKAERHSFAARLGTVLLTIAAPQNAPEGGAYLLAMYPGSDGPHILDCSWQPLSLAHRPPDTRLLFDNVGIPLAEPSVPEQMEEQDRKAAAQTRFFWMMATIVGKYIARRWDWEALAMLRFVSGVVG